MAFRDPALRRLTYVPSVDGCEGLYITPTLQVKKWLRCTLDTLRGSKWRSFVEANTFYIMHVVSNLWFGGLTAAPSIAAGLAGGWDDRTGMGHNPGGRR